MPSRQLPTSLAVARFLKERRKKLGYTLRRVAELSENDGKVIPLSTLARIEQGKLDPGLPRLQQLLRLYSVPIQIAGDLLDLEEFAGELPDETDADRLLAMAHLAGTRHDHRAAITVYLMLTHRYDEMEPAKKQRAMIGLAIGAAHFGKYQFSKYVAESILLEPVDSTIIISVLAHISRCWQWLRGHEAALAFIERAQAHLTKDTHPISIAHVFHQRASLCSQLNRLDEADASLQRALKEYRRGNDDVGYLLGLGTRVRIRFDQGRLEDALMTAQSARLYAQRHKIERLRLVYLTEMAKAEFLLGRDAACLQHLGAALADVKSDDGELCFHIHYYFWRLSERRGDAARARSEFETLVNHLGSTDAITDETAHVRRLVAARTAGKGKGKAEHPSR